MKKFLIVMACVFGVAAIVFYVSSIRELDKNSASILGTNAVINIQDTVFCAATAVMCVMNAIGAILISVMESRDNQTAKAVSDSASVPSAADEDAKARKVIEGGGWKCPQCGSLNMSYVSSCGCGMNKRDVLKKQQEQG